MSAQKNHDNRILTQTKPQKTYSDLIISYLAALDVDYIFGIPGGAIEPLYNALGRHMREYNLTKQTRAPHDALIPLRKRRSSNGIQPIVARHEAGAAFMADGYARETGKLGVCCATTGPGSTNLITGVASAYADKIPMLVITPQTAIASFGKMGMQESSSDAIDIVGMFEHCTRYNSLISHPNQFESKLCHALINAYRRPRGPVHLSIPMDILKMPLECAPSHDKLAHLFRQPEIIDEAAYSGMVQAVLESKRSVIFLGGDAKFAINDITQFAEWIGAEIVTAPDAKSLVSAYHPQYRGVFGFAGHHSAYASIMNDEVDLILAIGTSFDELSTGGWDNALFGDKVIHISETPEEFARTPHAKVHVQSDLKTLFKNLCNDLHNLHIPKVSLNNVIALVGQENEKETQYVPNTLILTDESQCYSNASPLKPQRVMRELATRLPENTRYIIEAGNSWSWSLHYLLQKSINTHRLGFGFSSMGWGIGAAIGTSLGITDNRAENAVVCLTGDGSFLMSGLEITTAVQERLPTIFVVLNDQALGMVKHGQRLGGAEQIGYKLPKVDFAALAKALGADGYTITKPEDFELDFAKICNADRPTVLDIHIDPEVVPPIGIRIKNLHR